MYKYEFVNVIASNFDSKSNGFRSIVLDRARQGWRFVAAVPVYWSENGRPIYIDLVFEKPENGNDELLERYIKTGSVTN